MKKEEILKDGLALYLLRECNSHSIIECYDLIFEEFWRNKISSEDKDWIISEFKRLTKKEKRYYA